MEQWRKDARSVPVITDLEALVPRGHLLREIEKIMITSGCMNGWTRTTAMTTAGLEQTRWC